ncbi:MAG: LacI family DNA-binding transcriptional regulator [Trueperaceae bacterium]
MSAKLPPKITLKALAKHLGVAASTVSNAYNRPDQLSEALRTKILETAKELGYSGPDPMAANLRRGRSGAIGVVYPHPLSYTFTDPVAVLFIQGIAQEAENAGYGLLLVGSSKAYDETAPLVSKATVDGFVVHNFAKNDSLFEIIAGRNLPIVLVESQISEGYPYIVVDDEEGALSAASHLLSLGHRRLGIISLELTSQLNEGLIDEQRQAEALHVPTKNRLRGYRRAIEAAGLSWQKNVVVYETSDNTPEDGYKAAATLLTHSLRPTALLAMSDQLALGALRYANDKGLEVPKDLSIVGFDDAPLAAQTTPPLTTVCQPYVEKGRLAGQLLIAQLKGDSVESVVLPTELIVRGSSGKAKPGKPMK